MHESSKNVQACLADMYEPDWYGKDDVDSIVEVSTFSQISGGCGEVYVCRLSACMCVLITHTASLAAD